MQGHYTPSMAFGMCIRCHLFAFYFLSFPFPYFVPFIFFCYFGHHCAAQGDSDINNRRATHIRNHLCSLCV